MEGFSSFIKLYGKIDGTLKAGTEYTFVINQNKETLNVEKFNGEKWLYFSTVNDLGGTNAFLGISLLIMAAAVVVCLIILFIIDKVKQLPKNVEDRITHEALKKFN